jgi:hypothetical protein
MMMMMMTMMGHYIPLLVVISAKKCSLPLLNGCGILRHILKIDSNSSVADVQGGSLG